MNKRKIFAISGSTRTNSSNEAILSAIAKLYCEQFDIHFYNGLSELPHFNPDLDNENAPLLVKSFRKTIEDADGVIICTPEYVFSLPGSLKNAIEWTVSTTVFSGKPLAFIVASGLGEKTFESLSLIMNTVGAKIGEHARLLVQGARAKVINGEIADEITLNAVKKLVNSFVESMD